MQTVKVMKYFIMFYNFGGSFLLWMNSVKPQKARYWSGWVKHIAGDTNNQPIDSLHGVGLPS